MTKTAGPLWFSPVCDQVLTRVEAWLANYERGEVSATCKYNDPSRGVIDKPTKYAHQIPFTVQQFGHLAKIMQCLCPDQPLVEEILTVQKQVLPNGRLTPGPGGKQALHVIKLSFYREHVAQICSVLREAKSGKTHRIEDFSQAGKGLFE